MGANTMADTGDWTELRDQVTRCRLLEREVTDPVAKGLLRDIALELETEMEDRRTDRSHRALEPGMIEFQGRTVSCLVRNLSEAGAALDVISAGEIPDRFTLALPLEGTSHRCSLVWRRQMEIGVSFQKAIAGYPY